MNNYFTQEDDLLKWKTGDVKSLLKTVVCEVTSQHNTSMTGVEGDYIIMKAPDWVIVIPENHEKFLMVKQWRHGEKKLSIEFPGGVIDEGESPEEAAVRELREETGFSAGKITKIGTVNPNPALFDNHVHVFYAEELTSTGKQELDNDEFINYIEMSKDDVLEGMGTEQFPHAIMGTALCFYIKHKRSR